MGYSVALRIVISHASFRRAAIARPCDAIVGKLGRAARRGAAWHTGEPGAVMRRGAVWRWGKLGPGGAAAIPV
jgi:hypothetical protein